MRYKRAKSGTPYSNSRERVYDILKKYLDKNEPYGNSNSYGNHSYRDRYGKKKTKSKDNYQPKPKYNPNNSKYYPAKEKPPDAKMPSPLKHYGWTETTTPRPSGTNYGMHELNEKVGKLSREAREIRQAIEKENQEISELLKKLELNPEDPELLDEALKKLTEPSEINEQLAAHSENIEKIISDTTKAESKDKEEIEKTEDSNKQNEVSSKEEQPAESKSQTEEVWPGELTKGEAEELYRFIAENHLFESEKVQPVESKDVTQAEPTEDSEATHKMDESKDTAEMTGEQESARPDEVLDQLAERMADLEQVQTKKLDESDAENLLERLNTADNSIDEILKTLESDEQTELVEPVQEEESEET